MVMIVVIMLIVMMEILTIPKNMTAGNIMSLMGFSSFCISECLKILKLNIATENKDISSKMTSYLEKLLRIFAIARHEL